VDFIIRQHAAMAVADVPGPLDASDRFRLVGALLDGEVRICDSVY
jgi:hypothetical protein